MGVLVAMDWRMVHFFYITFVRDGGTRLFYTTDSLFLRPIQPNPVNDVAEVNFGLVEEGNIELLVLNERGDQVLKVISDFAMPGKYTEQFLTQDLPSGLYFVLLTTPTQTRSRSFIIQR